MASDIVILGSGMAGLGAAHRLREAGHPAAVFDKNPRPGGHTSSHTRDGFTFDEGPHVSFTKIEKVRDLFAKAIADDYLSIDAYIDNYWQGHWVRHPVVTNMHGLPTGIVVDTIRDYVEAKKVAEPKIANYEDWLVASYGRTYAEAFPMQYTRKYHTTEARNLSTEWVGPRLYQASLDEVLTGALTPASPNIHYVQDYRYPRNGGFAAFLTDLTREAKVQVNHEVTGINPKARELTFANGVRRNYGSLVSSIALPDLIPMIAGAPRDVVDASQTLACTTVVLVNLGINRPDVSRSSWTYYYDDEFPFSRVSYPRNYSPNVVPSGTSSIQAEVYFSKKYRPLQGHPDSCIEPTIEGLRRAGVIRPDDQIIYREAMLIPYANIIFDLDRPAALSTVHGFLEDLGIAWCGRYGEWGYLWSDEAFVSGEEAAQRTVDRL
ncbi:MAG: FAD-dependent oxidoreductase [Gammaproteobacteria bacterium]